MRLYNFFHITVFGDIANSEVVLERITTPSEIRNTFSRSIKIWKPFLAGIGLVTCAKGEIRSFQYTSNIPASPAYGVYIWQLIRYARASSNYSDFLKRHLHLRNRLLDQGY